MPLSLYCPMLRKMILWCALFSTFLAGARAEEFGISRRIPAQPQQPGPQILPYVVRIIAFDSTGQSFGTGSYVGTYGEYGVILTNQHVICDTEGLVHVHFPSGFSSFGAVIKSDKDWDLALVAISKPPQSIPTLPIARVPSKPGDPLWIVGFGSGSYRIAEGRCVRYLALTIPQDGTPPRNEIMEVSVSARKGDSGGPILNQKGELAGVLFGSDMIRNTAGSFCERVSRFLMETQDHMARLPSRPEAYFASQEENGPLHSLRDSRNAVPRTVLQNNTQSTAVPQHPHAAGSSGQSFGVRSSFRRYVQPVSNEQPRLQQQVPPQQAPQHGRESSATMGQPLTSQIPVRRIEPAKIVQTGHWAPSGAVKMPMNTMDTSAADSSRFDRYRLKLSADRDDTFFTICLSLNVLLAAGLTYFSVRLLRSDTQNG